MLKFSCRCNTNAPLEVQLSLKTATNSQLTRDLEPFEIESARKSKREEAKNVRVLFSFLFSFYWGGAGAIWDGTLSDTLAGVAARDHRIGCEKRPSWVCASSNRGRRKYEYVLLNLNGCNVRLLS